MVVEDFPSVVATKSRTLSCRSPPLYRSYEAHVNPLPSFKPGSYDSGPAVAGTWTCRSPLRATSGEACERCRPPKHRDVQGTILVFLLKFRGCS